MSHRDPELEDPRLREALRGALVRERAPEAWVHQAMSLPDLNAVSPTPRSRLKLVVPHLCGLGLLLGLVIAFFLRPDAAFEGWSMLSKGLPPGISISLEGFSQSELLAMVSTPFLIYFLYQGSRGVPVLHRHR